MVQHTKIFKNRPMIHISKKVIRFSLLSFSVIIFIHFLLSQKTYSVILDEGEFHYKLITASEEQYQSCLNSIPTLEGRTTFIQATKVTNLLHLPTDSIYGVYLAYFALVVTLLFTIKFANSSKNGNE